MASSDDPLADFWTADEPPEGISAALWIAVKSIKVGHSIDQGQARSPGRANRSTGGKT